MATGAGKTRGEQMTIQYRHRVDKVLMHLMTHGQKVAGRDRLGKTILFAKNQAHADFISERFDINYRHLKGQFPRVITFKTEYAQSLIDAFSLKEKSPHLAFPWTCWTRASTTRSGQPGLLQTASIQNQILANARPWYSFMSRPIRPRQGQAGLLRFRLLSKPRIL
jgi:hypothetical protein